MVPENFSEVYVKVPRKILGSFCRGFPKTSWKFSLKFENFSEVFGEVIIPLRIDAPEMSKLPTSQSFSEFLTSVCR